MSRTDRAAPKDLVSAHAAIHPAVPPPTIATFLMFSSTRSWVPYHFMPAVSFNVSGTPRIGPAVLYWGGG